jgi:peptidoglycan/LPS O-acetylase OafA/YrhL
VEDVPGKTTVLAPPTTAVTRSSNRKISWDIVRVSCVILVMIYHATFLGVFLHPELQPRIVVFPHQVGASLLLVISAYFACVTIGRGPVLRYWWGRVARLLPPFLAAVVTIYVVLQVVAIHGWWLPTINDLVANLLMLWNWKPAAYPLIDGSHWTVPLQLMGFSAAALLFRTKWGHGRRIVGLMWVAVIIPVAQWPLRLSGPPEAYRVIADGLGAHRWHLFVVGVAIWMWSTKRLTTPHFVSLLVACMLAQAVHNCVWSPTGALFSDWGSTLGVCIGMVVIALTAYGPDWDRFVPDWAFQPIQWFAGISYGVFLMHQTLGYVVSRELHDMGADPMVQTVAMLISGVLFGWMLTRTVERPVYRFLMDAYDRMQARPLAERP